MGGKEFRPHCCESLLPVNCRSLCNKVTHTVRNMLEDVAVVTTATADVFTLGDGL